MDQTIDFGVRQPTSGHCAVRLDVPINLPAKFRRPTQYILAAVRENHRILHAFCHERCVVLIVPDEATATRARQFTADLLATMCQTTKTFRLHVQASGASPSSGTALLREFDPAFGRPHPKTSGPTRPAAGLRRIPAVQWHLPGDVLHLAAPCCTVPCAHCCESGASASTGTAFRREFDPAFGHPNKKTTEAARPATGLRPIPAASSGPPPPSSSHLPMFRS